MERALQLVHAYGRPCPLCGKPMLYGQPLDLHHLRPIAAGGRAGPRAMAHRHCNRRQGQAIATARRARLPRKTKTTTRRVHSQTW